MIQLVHHLHVPRYYIYIGYVYIHIHNPKTKLLNFCTIHLRNWMQNEIKIDLGTT
jgi:hypothetical protein